MSGSDAGYCMHHELTSLERVVSLLPLLRIDEDLIWLWGAACFNHVRNSLGLIYMTRPWSAVAPLPTHPKVCAVEGRARNGPLHDPSSPRPVDSDAASCIGKLLRLVPWRRIRGPGVPPASMIRPIAALEDPVTLPRALQGPSAVRKKGAPQRASLNL